MHKSKLAGFIIDCKTSSLQDAAKFWGEALGMKTEELPDEEGIRYVKLIDKNTNLHIEVQSVEHQSRVHLDIETDDINAEVKRLEKLGATIVNHVNSWCVMQAPTGQKFCVVRKGSAQFESRANEW